jgi:hypothetical protein
MPAGLSGHPAPSPTAAMEAGDTYRSEIVNSARLVAAEPEWLEHHAKGVPMPTPEEYIAAHATIEVN